jgi:Leucine rich repeat variant
MTPLETAQNPQTAPEVLRRLLSSKDVAVRVAVAKNPNTPQPTLQILAALHPEALLENPVLAWLRFENPAWFTELPDFARLALLKTPNCPTAWLEATARGDGIQQLSALQNPNLPLAMLQSWDVASDTALSEAALLHVCHGAQSSAIVVDSFVLGLPAQTAPRLELQTELFKDMVASGLPLASDILQILAADFDPELRMLVAQRPDLPQALLEDLALDEDENVRLAAKQNRPCEFAERAEAGLLCKNKDVLRLARGQVRARVLAAQHASLSLHWLKKLAQDDDWRVRQAVAQNPKTPAPTLAKLSKDFDRDVRQAAAENPKTPSQRLGSLLADSHEEVAAAARANPSTPPELLELLHRLESKDLSLTKLESLPVWMESLVAAHPNTTAARLETLAKSEQSGVRVAVAKNQKTPQRLLEQLLEDPDPDVPLAMLERPHLPEALLQKLVAHPDVRVLESVSQYPALSKALLESLSKEGNWVVRHNVAAHRRCPSQLLEQLSKDPDPDVREACVRHAQANALVALHALGVELRLPEVLHQLESHDPNLSASWLEFVARRGNDLAKRFVASHPNLGLEIMHWLSTHDQWQIRAALAQNPNLPVALLQTLSTDSDRDVRCVVARHQHTPNTLLEALLADSDHLVRLELVKRGFALEQLSWDETDEVRAAIPESHLSLRRRLENGEAVSLAELEPVKHLPMVLRLLPKELLFDLEPALCHEQWQVRQAAVRNLHCTTEWLFDMGNDPDRDVRLEILRHPKATAEMVNRLMRDPDLVVRRAALSHPKLEPALRQTAQRYILDESVRSSTLNRIVALGLTTRVSELKKRKNYQALEWRERLAVVGNVHTPRVVLEKMAQDANCIVRAKALERLR